MAYQSNTIDEVINIFPLTDKSELRVTKISSQDGEFESLDLRTWYCTANNSEMKPTQKGVRIRKEHCEAVANLMLDCLK